MTETIYAPSTAIGGAIAILRVSGPNTKAAADALLSRDLTERAQCLLPVRIAWNGETLDRGMAVFFKAPHSYTGEDMLELHVHGGAATVNALLKALSQTGSRPAQAGEFTKRAFLNGKMDLSEAEAVMELINAQAEQSRKAALEQLGGGLSDSTEKIEDLLTGALAALDAAIDYPDEAEADAYAMLPIQLNAAKKAVQQLILEGRGTRYLKEGLRVVIAGRPNVGKSSLLNALLGEERAIVTTTAGTTRDLIDERCTISGYPVRLIDTAGLRETTEEAERIGVDRARAAMERADLILLVLDGSVRLTQADEALLSETAASKRLVLANKMDLFAGQSRADNACLDPRVDLCVSAASGEGLEELRRRIPTCVLPTCGDGLRLVNERQLHALQQAEQALTDAGKAQDLDAVATDIGEALHSLGSISGRDVDAAVLDRIFADFCVGK